MTRREGRPVPPDERERLAHILKAAFPIESEGSFTSLLRTLDVPHKKASRE